MTNNFKRWVGNAEITIEAFRRTSPGDYNDADTETVMADLICGLGHMADQHGINFVQVAEHALGMWSAERLSPCGEPAGNDFATVTITPNEDLPTKPARQP
jgi:hypothetical protein